MIPKATLNKKVVAKRTGWNGLGNPGPRPDLRNLGRSFGTDTGTKSAYQEAYCRIVYKLRLLGISENNIADILEINFKTLVGWRHAHPAFKEAWDKGGALADAKVARSLFGRANGSKIPAVKIFNNKGEIITVPYTEHYPPDTSAIELWLTNRQPDLWKKRSSQELTGAGGSALNPPPTLVFDFSGKDGPLIEGDAEEVGD